MDAHQRASTNLLICRNVIGSHPSPPWITTTWKDGWSGLSFGHSAKLQDGHLLSQSSTEKQCPADLVAFYGVTWWMRLPLSCMDRSFPNSLLTHAQVVLELWHIGQICLYCDVTGSHWKDPQPLQMPAVATAQWRYFGRIYPYHVNILM